MNGEIIQGLTSDKYDHFQHFNFIFSQNFISLFGGLSNDGIDLRVRYNPGIWYTSFGCINIVVSPMSTFNSDLALNPCTMHWNPLMTVVDEPHNWVTKAHFYTRSQGQCSTQIKHSLLVQKLKSAPKGFTLRVKAEIEKNLFNLPQVTNNCRALWPCIGPKAEKRIPSKFGKPICNSWGQCSSIY